MELKPRTSPAKHPKSTSTKAGKGPIFYRLTGRVMMKPYSFIIYNDDILSFQNRLDEIQIDVKCLLIMIIPMIAMISSISW